MYNSDTKKVADGFFESGVGGLLKGFIWAFVLNFILLAAGALVITYSPMSEESIPLISLASFVMSVAIGGMKSAKTADSKG
ncbi:MAG: TIGR04086 family membrane protein, partial [Clostridia bacterium]|nr:TIGR04086 family membrane protein [Clostridia bacterium]